MALRKVPWSPSERCIAFELTTLNYGSAKYLICALGAMHGNYAGLWDLQSFDIVTLES